MKNQNGFTLVEIVVAMLLTAIMAGSMFSLALTARQGGARGFRKLVADQAARQLSEQLKSYVTIDYASTSGIAGPGRGANKWSMNDTTVVPNIQDDCGTGSWPTDCYALALGNHNIKGYLPAWFAAAPYNATILYTVSSAESITYGTKTGNVLNVNVTTDWDEPKP